MPANVETMAYYGEKPWHGLGTRVRKDVTAEGMIQAAGLDWEVELRPARGARKINRKGEFSRYEVVRPPSPNKGEEEVLLGVVSRRYQPLQNVEAFTFFDSIVQEGKAYFETAGSLGESYLGQRVYDLLRTIDFLEDGGATVSLIGRGIGSVPTVLAALLHRSQPACEIVDYLPSYEFLIDRPVHNWPLSCFIENCLAAFDLPDIYAALGNKLQEREPWGAMP